MNEPGNEDQVYFYESRISEMMIKIKENQQYIDSIYQRMGIEPPPPVYTLEIEEPPAQVENLEIEQREGIY